MGNHWYTIKAVKMNFDRQLEEMGITLAQAIEYLDAAEAMTSISKITDYPGAVGLALDVIRTRVEKGEPETAPPASDPSPEAPSETSSELDPNAQRESKNEWITVKSHRSHFWATMGRLGATNVIVHDALGVESLYDWPDSGKVAVAVVTAYMKGLTARRAARAKAKETIMGLIQERDTDEYKEKAARLQAIIKDAPEAAGVYWCIVQLPHLPSWRVTIREVGLPQDLMEFQVERALDVMDMVVAGLGERGYNAIYDGRDQAVPIEIEDLALTSETAAEDD